MTVRSAKKRITKLRRSLKKSMKKGGSKSKRTRSLRKSLKKARKSLKSAQLSSKKSSSKKSSSKKSPKRKTRKSAKNIPEFKCNIKKSKSNTRGALTKEIRSYVKCVEKRTGTNQDMELSKLREEPVSSLKRSLKFYRKNY